MHIRGYDSFDRKATLPRRVLAHVTDLPVWLALPTVSVLGFGVPPLPGPGMLALWAAWAVVLTGLQWRLAGQTLGERMWGLKHFKGRGCQERKSWSLTFQINSLASLFVSLALTAVMLERMLEFHPMLRDADEVTIPAFEPPAASHPDARRWSVLPFYMTIGAYPRLWKEEPVWYQLPYVKGPPERFPARVLVRLPVSEATLVLEGPRTPEELRGKRDWVRACLTADSMRVRVAPECLKLRRGLLLRHSQEMRPGGSRPSEWGLAWFEVENPALGPESRPMGVYLRAVNSHHQVHRFILITSEGQAQAVTLELPVERAPEGSVPRLEPELEMMFQLVGSMSLHPTLAGSRSWADRRLSEVKLADVARRPELDRLGELAALLIAKTSVSPRQPDAFYHLAGVSMLLLKKSSKTPAAELVSAIARPQVEASTQFMRDVAPSDPRNRQLEQMLIEVKAFR